MCNLTNLINQRASDNYNRIKTMKTRKAFTEAHPELNQQQLKSAYQMVEIEGWQLTISEPTFKATLTKDGKQLTLKENGNAL